jgi:hypothetical protein
VRGVQDGHRRAGSSRESIPGLIDGCRLQPTGSMLPIKVSAGPPRPAVAEGRGVISNALARPDENDPQLTLSSPCGRLRGTAAPRYEIQRHIR